MVRKRMPFTWVGLTAALLALPLAAYSTEIVERGCRAEVRPLGAHLPEFSEDGREVHASVDYQITDEGDGGVVQVTFEGYFDMRVDDDDHQYLKKKVTKGFHQNTFTINSDRSSVGTVELIGSAGGLCGPRRKWSEVYNKSEAEGCSLDAITIERVECRD